jgi:hypothetical protein
MTPDLLHILQHSLGVDQYGRGQMYRSHFVTSAGYRDHDVCLQLCELGYMVNHGQRMGELTGGSDLFIVTDAGKEAVRRESPQPPPEPKWTRSKRRYQEFLNADTGLTFAEWLKCRKARTA